MLANGRTWVFGEQYTLAVDDQGLTKVQRHIAPSSATTHRSTLLSRTPRVTPGLWI